MSTTIRIREYTNLKMVITKALATSSLNEFLAQCSKQHRAQSLLSFTNRCRGRFEGADDSLYRFVER